MNPIATLPNLFADIARSLAQTALQETKLNPYARAALTPLADWFVSSVMVGTTNGASQPIAPIQMESSHE